MAQTSNHHHELTNGVGKCSVPMWQGGCPAGFCDAPAFGKQTKYGREYVYDGYVPGLACHAHGGPKCQGIEIEPGKFSGCKGLPDCPVCSGK